MGSHRLPQDSFCLLPKLQERADERTVMGLNFPEPSWASACQLALPAVVHLLLQPVSPAWVTKLLTLGQDCRCVAQDPRAGGGGGRGRRAAQE